MKKYNFDITYFVSTNGDIVLKDDLDKWIESCPKNFYETSQVISKDYLFPIYEIFEELIIQKHIKSVIVKCYRIKFAKPLDNSYYQIFGNVVECSEKQQQIKDVIVKFKSK
ncbi:1779_t:CDS:2, partial [Racocetra fulgida]